MILINLLPPEAIIKEKKQIKIPLVPIMIGVFGIFVAISIYNLYYYLQIHDRESPLPT